MNPLARNCQEFCHVSVPPQYLFWAAAALSGMPFVAPQLKTLIDYPCLISVMWMRVEVDFILGSSLQQRMTRFQICKAERFPANSDSSCSCRRGPFRFAWKEAGSPVTGTSRFASAQAAELKLHMNRISAACLACSEFVRPAFWHIREGNKSMPQGTLVFFLSMWGRSNVICVSRLLVSWQGGCGSVHRHRHPG